MGYRPPATRVTLKEFLAMAKAEKWDRDGAAYVVGLVQQLGGDVRLGNVWYRIIDLQKGIK